MMSNLEEKFRLLGIKKGASDLPTPTQKSKNGIEDVIIGNFWSNPQGEIFVSENYFPSEYFEGRIGIFSLENTSILSTWAKNDIPDNMPTNSIYFLDTETTGLSGGTGTYTFLVGIGRIEDNLFHLYQFFMRDPSEETALLFAIEELIASCSIIVTFNGKSFDIPLLKSRYQVNGWKEPFSTLIHIDLLHLARKLWKNRLPSRTLPNLEAQILGILRTEEDIPGWMVPQIYFDYLRDGDATPLRNVFYHNSMDVVSLGALLIYINKYLIRPEGTQPEFGVDVLSLAKLYEDLGHTETAIELYSQGLNHKDFMDKPMPEKFYLEAVTRLAIIHKRKNDFSSAVELFEKAAQFRYLPAFIELAKIYEHNLQNYEAAIRCARTAFEALDEMGLPKNEKNEWTLELEHRMKRLIKKLS